VTDAYKVWLGAGYTRDKAESSWKHIARTWSTVFADKGLGMQIIPTDGFPAVTSSGAINTDPLAKDKQTTTNLVRSAAETYGSRVYVLQNSLNATRIYPAVEAGRLAGANVGAQFDAGEYKYPACPKTIIPSGQQTVPCNPADFRAAADNGIVNSKAKYLEIFTNDQIAYGASVRYIHCTLNISAANCP
jgi:hypothetical protein